MDSTTPTSGNALRDEPESETVEAREEFKTQTQDEASEDYE